MSGVDLQPTNTYDAYDAGTDQLTGGSNREDLADIIYNIAPTDTPFISGAGRGTATNAKTEWLTDTLATSASNYQLEGDDYAGEARTPPTRLHAYTQISAKALVVSGTQEVIDKAGRKSEIAYQLALQAKELKRDMERHCVGFATSADASALGAGVSEGGSFPNSLGAGTPGGARTCANLGTWIFTNVDANGTVAPGQAVTGQPDDGDSRDPGVAAATALTEANLQAIILGAWNEGGNPRTILVNGANKQVISGFGGGTAAGAITKIDRTEDKTLYTSIDVYVSDFGDHTVIPDRFIIQPLSGDGTACYVLDMNYWSIKYLRPFMQTPLAKSGDSEKRLLLAEWAMCSHNEKASGALFNLSPAT